MRHLYKTPAIRVTHILSSAMVAASLTVDTETTTTTQYVKEDRSSRGGSSYNVWDDDWSKE